MRTIGIPRSLLYYEFAPLWVNFFKKLNTNVIISTITDSKKMELGINTTVDDTCMPVKVYHGHIQELNKRDIDFLFVPRIVSFIKNEFICPKFSGLPDTIINNLEIRPKIISPVIDVSNSNNSIKKAMIKAGKKITNNYMSIYKAYSDSLKSYKIFKERLANGENFDILINMVENKKKIKSSKYYIKKYNSTILLLGHPYILYDHYLNLDIFKKLNNAKTNILTPQMLNENLIEKETNNLPKKLFWTLEKNLLGSTLYAIKNKEVDGIIWLASFGCGPDSIIGELSERIVKDSCKTPFLFISLDEHSSEVGFITRLEAFLDMIERRKTIENNLSSYG